MSSWLLVQNVYDNDSRVWHEAEDLVSAGYSLEVLDVLALVAAHRKKTHTLNDVNVARL